MGELEVPADALYGASTQRAVLNFPISGQRFPRRFLRALAEIKQAAAETNAELGLLERPVAEAISAAATEVAEGRHDDHFPIDVYQTGSGTSTNTNMNEVVAHLATDRLGKPTRPPERRRQPLPVVERRHPDRAPALGGGRDRGAAPPGPRATPHRARRPRAGLLAGGQDRPDAPPGRHADPARAGVPRLCRPGRGIDPPGARRAGRAAVGAARRHGGRDRHQCPPGVRVPDVCPPRRPDRPRRPRDPEPFPRPGHARRADRGPRRAAHDRAVALEDRFGRAADGDGAARRPRRNWHSRRPSRGRASCPARSTR